MLIEHLCPVLQACLSNELGIRQQAEAALKQAELEPGQVVALLRVAAEDTVDAAIRQVAAISFKNLVRRSWEHEEDKTQELSEADKQMVRDNILESLTRAPHIVQVQLAVVFKSIVYSDYPEKFPDLLQRIHGNLVSPDQVYVHGGLSALRILIRKYEFRDADETPAMNAIVNATFPLLLRILQTLVATPATPGSQVPEYCKIIYKTFWSATFMGIPDLLIDREVFVAWMTAFHTAIVTPIPQEVLPEDLEERAATSWWTARKWLLHIVHRIFDRYSIIKHCRENNDKAFALMWTRDCMIQFLDAQVQQLAALPGGAYCSPRCLNLLLQYMTHAVSLKPAYVHVKAHWDDVLASVVFPLMAFNDQDAELWADDPQDYVRKGYDMVEEMYSPKSAAMNFAHELCSAKKVHLDRFMVKMAALLAGYGQAVAAAVAVGGVGGAADVAAARQVDGALLAIGSIGDVLKVKAPYRDQLGQMLLTYVLPCFQSPHGHLRAKACWLAGIYADTEFPGGKAIGSGYCTLFEHVVRSLSDSDLPVRVDAVIALRQFVDGMEDAEDLDLLRPLLPQLLTSIFALMDQVDNEELVDTLGCLVEKFGEDIAPYALQMCVQLSTAFWRYAGNTDDEDDETSGIAAFSCIKAINTVLESVSGLKHLYPTLEEALFPIMQKMLSTEGQDIFEEVLEMLGMFTYYSGAISDRLWSLWPALHECMVEFGVDYWENLLIPLDNFIGRDPHRFLTCTTPDYQLSAFQMAQHSLGVESKKTHSERDVVPAARLIEIVLQNCRGRMDSYVPLYINLALDRMAAGVEHLALQDALVSVVANALYYNAPLTLAVLQARGATASFFTSWFTMIFASRKIVTATGLAPGPKPRHFRRMCDKKVVVLGLVSLLACPEEGLPADLAGGMGQVTAGVLKVLTFLKLQQDEAAKLAAQDSDDEDEGEESDDDVDVGEDWASDDYDKAMAEKETKDGAYLENLQKQARAMVDGGDGSDEEDEYTDNEEGETPIDPIDPYVFFADALQMLHATMPARYQGVVAGVDGQVVQGMLQHADVQRAEMAKKAALPQ